MTAAGRKMSRSLSPSRVKNFLYDVQTGFMAHPTSYPIGTKGVFPLMYNGRGVKLTSHLQDEENLDLYIHSPTRLHGVLLDKLSARKN
jgi:hypothetical protein